MTPSSPTDLKKEPENPDEPAGRQVNLRLDAEHDAALTRLMAFEKLNAPDVVRKLIRIADQMVSGDQSPFAARLEHLLLAKVG